MVSFDLNADARLIRKRYTFEFWGVRRSISAVHLRDKGTQRFLLDEVWTQLRRW